MSSQPNEQEKPAMRYSDLARGTAPAAASTSPAAAPTDVLAFRAIKELKNGAAPPPAATVQRVASDSRAGEFFQQMTRDVNRIYDAARLDQSFRIEPLFGLAESIIAHSDPGRLVGQIFEDHRRATYAYRNATHCGIIAAQIGRGLGYAKDELVLLTVAAFLHDIGVQKLPVNLLEKPGKLTADEFAMVQTHPELGYRLLTQHAAQLPRLAQIVRQEHERERGQGYPQKLSAHEILDPAKVIGVTDVYDALITPRPYRKAFCPHEAIKELLECQERMGYARHVVRALIQQLTLFPVGCWVRLSSEEIGQVIQTNSRSPLRPVVEVFYSGDGARVGAERIVNLNDNPLVYIVSSLCETDLPATPVTAASGLV
jgi:HD-GYP domain-containing protein (c-di-GMP phosphodiesterase class II)